jgi:quercetin dioxygenase-like cupin family protein
MCIRFLVTTVIALLLLAISLDAQDHPKVVNTPQMKFQTPPNAPVCAQSAVQSGDPSKGASLMFIKFSAACTVPLHWHTPNEQIMMISGTGKLTSHPGEPQTLQRGAYAFMPAKHHHSFSCSMPCTFYLTSDGVFDVHYVDASGREISPDEALKSANKRSKK